jgi:hypothetical protein
MTTCASRRGILLGIFSRAPQLSPGEVLHLGIGMRVLKTLERWQQLIALGRAKRSRQAASHDRPVHVAWRHLTIRSDPFQFLNQRRPFEMQQVCRFVSVAARSFERTVDEVSLDRGEIRR